MPRRSLRPPADAVLDDKQVFGQALVPVGVVRLTAARVTLRARRVVEAEVQHQAGMLPRQRDLADSTVPEQVFVLGGQRQPEAKPAVQRVHRGHASAHVERVTVEVHRGVGAENQSRRRGARADSLREWALRVPEDPPRGTRDRIDDVAQHLRAEFGEADAQPVIGELMQTDPAPHAAGVGLQRQRVASLHEALLQGQQPPFLLGRGLETDPQAPIHI